MRYHLDCLHCGTRIATTERVGDGEVVAVEDHLRGKHAEVLPAGKHLDFAEVLGHVRVKMGD